jgi:hypothetical protein
MGDIPKYLFAIVLKYIPVGPSGVYESNVESSDENLMIVHVCKVDSFFDCLILFEVPVP